MRHRLDLGLYSHPKEWVAQSSRSQDIGVAAFEWNSFLNLIVKFDMILLSVYRDRHPLSKQTGASTKSKIVIGQVI